VAVSKGTATIFVKASSPGSLYYCLQNYGLLLYRYTCSSPNPASGWPGPAHRYTWQRGTVIWVFLFSLGFWQRNNKFGPLAGFGDYLYISFMLFYDPKADG